MEQSQSHVSDQETLQIAKSAFDKLRSGDFPSVEENDAILKLYDADPEALYGWGEGSYLAGLLKARNAREADAKREAQRLAMAATKPLRGKNLLETIQDEQIPLDNNPPTMAIIAKAKLKLVDLFFEMAEHRGWNVDLSPGKEYLVVLGNNPISKFSLKTGGFFVPGESAPVIGSNIITAYLFLFWGLGKVRKVTMPNGNEKIQPVSEYMRKRAETDIQEWLRRIDNGAVTSRPNPEERLEEITALTANALTKAERPFRSAKSFRNALRDRILDRTPEMDEDQLWVKFPQLFSRDKFSELLTYWAKQDDLPFSLRVKYWHNDTIQITAKAY
jgi:hypothetical protein